MHPLCLVILLVLVPATCGEPGHVSAPPLLDVLPFVTPIETAFADGGLEHLSRRGLAFSGAGSCVWVAESQTCRVSLAATVDILRSSQGGTPELYFHELECQSIGTNETQCTAVEKCGWDRQLNRCAFVDMLGQFSDSPCVANAPLLFTYSRLFDQCPSRTTSTACRELDGCTWNEERNACYADMYHVDFGLESEEAFRANTTAVDRFKTSTALAHVAPVLTIVSKKIPDWHSTFAVKMPQTGCPEDYDKLICDYVDTYMEDLFPHYIYCTDRYHNANISACNPDPLCAYSESEGCVQNALLTSESLAIADELLLDRVPSSTDKVIIRQALRCLRIRNATECTDHCRWTGLSCVVGNAFMDKELLKNAGQNLTDPICQHYHMRVHANCSSSETAAICLEMPNCGWDLLDETCKLSNAKVRDEIFRQDPNLEKPFLEAQATCYSFKDAMTCTGG